MMGILDSIMTPVSQADDPLAEREKWLNMSQLFNSFTMDPSKSQGYYNSQQAGIDRQRKGVALKAANAQSNKTMQGMVDMGLDPNLLALAKGNPALMQSVQKSFVDNKLNPNKYMVKFSSPKIDEETGQYYVIATDPNTNKTSRIDVPNATGITSQGAINMQTNSEAKAADIAKAQEIGQQAFGQANAIDGMLTKLQSAKGAVARGASSGAIARFIPSFNEATSELRSMANMLGIDIINSATFGALSEKELQLALSTGLDLSLQGDQLQQHIDNKIAAQTKMRNALLDKAKKLTSSGTTYSSYIQEMSSVKRRELPIVNFNTPAAATGGVTFSQAQIDRMTPDQKKIFKALAQ